jgi:ribosome-associated toxin RatA of RatAB toxin-antitoxin module
MAMVEKTVLIEHSAHEMFALVDDCESYPKFLPWCSQTEVKFRDQAKTVATLHISFLGVNTRFTTENAKEIPLRMNIKLVDGPFRQLEGLWRFKPLAENACRIDFRLAYEFSGRWLEKAVGPVFSQIANTMVDAFVKRAGEVYGEPNA